jgi:hypothetical protein
MMLDPGGQDYRCSWFPADVRPDAAVKAMHPFATPGVHHVALFWAEGDSVQPDRDCWSFGSNWVLIAGAGVNSGDVVFPSGIALPLRSGGAYVIQTHMLNAMDHALSIQAGYDLTLTAAGESFTSAGIYVTGVTRFQIPAATMGYSVETLCPANKLPAGASLINVFPHMHKLGTNFFIERIAGATKQTLLENPWNFDNQIVVPIQPAVALGTADILHIRCTYDNPGTMPVSFGESTTDEMCFAVFYYEPATQPEIDCVH